MHQLTVQQAREQFDPVVGVDGPRPRRAAAARRDAVRPGAGRYAVAGAPHSPQGLSASPRLPGVLYSMAAATSSAAWTPTTRCAPAWPSAPVAWCFLWPTGWRRSGVFDRRRGRRGCLVLVGCRSRTARHRSATPGGLPATASAAVCARSVVASLGAAGRRLATASAGTDLPGHRCQPHAPIDRALRRWPPVGEGQPGVVPSTTSVAPRTVRTRVSRRCSAWCRLTWRRRCCWSRSATRCRRGHRLCRAPAPGRRPGGVVRLSGMTHDFLRMGAIVDEADDART